MKVRALVAVGVAAAMLSGGAAVAADQPDDPITAEAWHTVDAPKAPSGATADADELAGDQLSAALTGAAAQALGLINQYRVQNGVQPLREDPSLTGMAQNWATHSSNLGTYATDPDLGTATKPLPGYPVAYAELGSYGPLGVSINDYVATIANSPTRYLYDSGLNHIGVGWSVNGTKAVLYLIVVEYTFRDIGPSDTFYDPVDWLAYYGITTGYPDGTFRPTGQVSREAMAAFLYRYFNDTTTLPACAGTTRMFTDVTAGHPFCGAIEWLAEQEISTGYPDGTFRPGQPVSREAMGAFLYRAFMKQPIPTCTDGTRRFTDVPASHPFCGALEWLATAGITTGWSDHTFRPGLSVERQAMAAFLYRAAP